MNTSLASFIRGFVGFIVGGIVAAIASGVAFAAICREPPEVPNEPDYYPYALVLVVFNAFLCGGVVGLRGFTMRRASGLFWPVVGCYTFMVFQCIWKEASFHEGAPLIAFASVGIAASVGVSLVVSRWFPQSGLHDMA